MAYLGTIAKTRKTKISVTYHWWDDAVSKIISNDRQGHLAGYVKIQGVPVANALVRLYWLPTGKFTLLQTFTDAQGYYSFSALPRNHVNKYQIIFLKRDNAGALDITFNAARHTHLTPL